MIPYIKNRIWRITTGVLLAIVGCALGMFFWLNWQVASARELVDDQRWSDASQILRRYLKFQPHDAEARILMVHSLLCDNSLPIKTVAEESLSILEKIPTSSSESASARVIEGRIYLLLLLQPHRAEKCLLASIQADPHRTDSRALLRKLYDLTGRWHLCNDHFWQLYANSQPRDRASLLRDWYMSEFNPGSSSADLDRQLGILGADERPSSAVERRRYETFIAAEPDSPLGYACLARWFHQQGTVALGLEVIKQAEELTGGKNDPFVIATHVPMSFERGDFDEAQARFLYWPADDDGYEYWKTKGLISDQILRQNAEARSAYENALSTPAGQSDWLTRHRLSQVLMRMGLTEEAGHMRNRSKELELQMEPSIHKPLREALIHPELRETQEQMAQFYDRIGRPRESSAWRELDTNQTPLNFK